MKYKFTSIIYVAILVLAFSSCNKYLDVAPKSSIPEEEMFSSEIGFRQALTGVYSMIASRALYGDNLSMGFVSALAQNYNTSGTGTEPLFVPTRNYDYSSEQVLAYTKQIWSAGYNGIAATNNIIKFADLNKRLLTEEVYQQVLGEAFALRAFLHFELVRMFAPSYSQGASATAIPYKTAVDQYSVKPSTVEQVLAFALEDLNKAESLLVKSDPIRNNTLDRRYKMNYYAVKGIQARIYLYGGNTTDAYKAAKEVVDSGKFPFVSKSSVAAAAGTKDRLFREELIFAIRNRELKTWAEDKYFTFWASIDYRLTRPDADLRSIYEYSTVGQDDIRYRNLFEDNQGFKFPSKFWQTSTTTIDSLRLDQTVPVVRMSEMRYIIAETAPTAQEALDVLNTVRLARTVLALPSNADNLDRNFIQNEITKEYQKEMYAEGQLFFYYKRLNLNMVPFTPEKLVFDPKFYVLPVPQDELEFNPNY